MSHSSWVNTVQLCFCGVDEDHFPVHFFSVAQSVEPVPASGPPGNTVDDQPHRKQGISMVSADMGLVSMVRQGILALQLLPPNSSSGRFVIKLLG